MDQHSALDDASDGGCEAAIANEAELLVRNER